MQTVDKWPPKQSRRNFNMYLDRRSIHRRNSCRDEWGSKDGAGDVVFLVNGFCTFEKRRWNEYTWSNTGWINQINIFLPCANLSYCLAQPCMNWFITCLKKSKREKMCDWSHLELQPSWIGRRPVARRRRQLSFRGESLWEPRCTCWVWRRRRKEGGARKWRPESPSNKHLRWSKVQLSRGGSPAC